MTQKTPGLSDQELISEVRAQSRAGAEELYDRYAKVLLLAIFRVNPDFNSANDILCETYRSAWRTSHTYLPEESSLLAWMMRIAKERAAIHLGTNIILKSIHLCKGNAGDQ